MATKSSPSIRFTNIPSHYDRTKLYSLFSKYGKVTKLFLQPEYEYGNVYLETAEICEKTYKDLKSNCELKLTLLQPRTSSEYSNDSSSKHNSSSSKDNGYNDVDTSVVKNFVDVFGRLVTTLKDDDGNLYVSLTELKRSGFELFEIGTLPARDGSHIHNQQKLEQFKIYMKSKANEFMSQSRYNVSTETIDEIIESEKKSFFGDCGETNSTTRRSFDNAGHDRSRSRPGRSNYNESGQSYYKEQRNTDNFHSNKNGTPNSDANERYRNQNRRSFSDTNRSHNNSKGFGLKQEQCYENKSNTTTVENDRLNNIKPLTQMHISLNEPQEENDGTYIVKDVQPDTSHLSTSTPIKTENVDPPAQLRKPHIASPIPQEVDLPPKKVKRNLVIETVCDAGVFQFCETTGDRIFTGFALPDGFDKEFEMLSEIGSNSAKDSKFSPKIGDIVGVDHDGDVARGLILSRAADQYRCALIDYGVSNETSQVRQLQEKYTGIPEFSFECEAEANVINKLQLYTGAIKLSIKSPCKLSLCLESGETYELIGKPIHSESKEKESNTLPPKTSPLPKAAEPSTEATSSATPQEKPVHKTDEIIFTPRKLVIEDLCDRGTFDFVERTGDSTFTCFVCPEKYITDLNLLDMIYKDTKVDKSFKPHVGDLVAANVVDDGIVRGIVLNTLNDEYELALIDYGTIRKVSDVRALPEKYMNIPEFVCECKVDPEIIKDLENVSCQALQIKAPGMLSVKLENGVQHVLKGYRWIPTKDHMNSFKTINKCETYKRPANVLLKDGDKVLLVSTLNNGLLVRNRECHTTFTAVTQELANYQGKPYEQPQVGCLAVCNFHDNQLYRVVINKIDGATATLDYIDFGNIDTAPVSSLKTINEKLATMNSTLANIHLKDFVKQEFNPEMVTFLGNCSERREKFKACKIPGEEVYDLVGADGVSLTEKLNKIQKNQIEDRSTTPKSQTEKKLVTPKSQEKSKSVSFNLEESTTPTSQRVKDSVCQFGDLVKFDVKPGDLKLLCTYVGHLDEGLVSFCKADEETNMLLDFVTETVTNCMQKDTDTSYTPSLGEVCLAKFEGDWFRAAVVKIFNNKFKVYFVDYGNHHDATISDLRKLPAELSKAKAIAMICKLDGVMKDNAQTVNDRLLSRLKDDIVESEIYHATISSISDHLYYLIIPSLMKQWKADGLV